MQKLVSCSSLTTFHALIPVTSLEFFHCLRKPSIESHKLTRYTIYIGIEFQIVEAVQFNVSK